MMIIPNENEALEYIYANHKPGALYTIMCDVVAGALDKIKGAERKRGKRNYTVCNIFLTAIP